MHTERKGGQTDGRMDKKHTEGQTDGWTDIETG